MITPPSFVRHITPWKVLEWIDRRYNTCWVAMVMWKMGYGWKWWPEQECFDANPAYDYCGKFKDHGFPLERQRNEWHAPTSDGRGLGA